MSHEPVMVDEIVDLVARPLAGVPRPRLVDCTLGGGGHARALLEALPEAELLGLDRDPAAVERCATLLRPFAGRVSLVHADYRRLRQVIEKKAGRGRSPGSSPTSASRASSSRIPAAASPSRTTGRWTCASIPARTFPPRPTCSRSCRSRISRACFASWATSVMPAASARPWSGAGGRHR